MQSSVSFTLHDDNITIKEVIKCGIAFVVLCEIDFRKTMAGFGYYSTGMAEEYLLGRIPRSLIKKRELEGGYVRKNNNH